MIFEVRIIFFLKNVQNFRATNIKTQKCCLSPILATTMKIPKMAKIVYGQMSAPRDLPEKTPPPGKN